MEMLCTLRSTTEAQRQALREAPESLEPFLEDEEDFGDPKGAAFLELDIGEAWHGLQYLLTGTAWEGQPPLDFLVRGGDEVGDIPSDEGTARVFDAASVKALAEALKQTPVDALRERFDPARLQAEDIYPGTWDEEEPTDDVDPLEELLSYFVELQKFTAAVAKRGLSLLVHIG
ncbi:YfbM family protein [Corallococcus sp. EGB]|uniref:YfbM family protein n=1 Tax=Corallococcus sp. EGB TaxID=1521117 RepID=UPI001CBAB6B2|nr:YfbM family protein [Corallococcus sp. EGB]